MEAEEVAKASKALEGLWGYITLLYYRPSEKLELADYNDALQEYSVLRAMIDKAAGAGIMAKTMEIKIHAVATDGLPNMEKLVGRVAYIWDGSIVSGWPVTNGFESGEQMWEPSENRYGGPVIGVTHWLEFPEPFWNIKDV